MKANEVIKKLVEKKMQLETEMHKYDDRCRMSRKMLFTDMRRQVRNMRKCRVIDAAISLINDGFGNVDVYDAVLYGIADTRADKDHLLGKSNSMYLNERKEALREAFETSLPICKKQVFYYLN